VFNQPESEHAPALRTPRGEPDDRFGRPAAPGVKVPAGRPTAITARHAEANRLPGAWRCRGEDAARPADDPSVCGAGNHSGARRAAGGVACV